VVPARGTPRASSHGASAAAPPSCLTGRACGRRSTRSDLRCMRAMRRPAAAKHISTPTPRPAHPHPTPFRPPNAILTAQGAFLSVERGAFLSVEPTRLPAPAGEPPIEWRLHDSRSAMSSMRCGGKSLGCGEVNRTRTSGAARLTASTSRAKSALPAPAFPSSIFRDKNRRDVGKSQPKRTASKMETPGSPTRWRL
jgi:hypothetical protein